MRDQVNDFKADINKLTHRFENAPNNVSDMEAIDANLQSIRQRHEQNISDRGDNMRLDDKNNLEKDSFMGDNHHPLTRIISQVNVKDSNLN